MSEGLSEIPTVSVTIVLHNSAEHLEECIAAIRPELLQGVAELIAVDNDSPDDSAEIVGRVAAGTRVIDAGGNLGFAGGVNLAWPHVRGRYWLLLNPDAVLEPGALRLLSAWMDEHRRIGIASAELADETGAGPRSAGRALPSPWLALLEASRAHLLVPRKLRGQMLRGAYWTAGDQLDAGWVPGTAMIARREAVEHVGLLDERFFLYGEDIEWCWRMRRAGWRIGVCSSVTARHRGRSSSIRAFGEGATQERMVTGEVDAVRAMRGKRYARRYARAVALALRIEARHPRRPREHRKLAGAGAREWEAAARRSSGAVGSLLRTPRRVPIVLFLGEKSADGFMEGGSVRLHHLIRSVDRAGVRTVYCPPDPFGSLRLFVRSILRSGVLRPLLSPFHRALLVSPGRLFSPRVLKLLMPLCVPLYFDFHDEPRAQFEDLGIAPLGQDEASARGRLLDLCMARFRVIGVATPGLGQLCPEHFEKFIDVPNAGDPDHFPVTTPPDSPVVALVGSTSPGRGADLLIDACEVARKAIPDLQLRLALDNIDGRGNLEALRCRHSAAKWISFERVDYPDIPSFLSEAAVCVVPHRRSPYADLARPIKLFDYMAACRAVVTTDCTAVAELVRTHRAGLVCRADPNDMADKLTTLLRDRRMNIELGQNGRRAIERELNWAKATRPLTRVIQARASAASA